MARRLISPDDFDHMEIKTDTGQIFWYGEEVVTSMALPRWAQVSGIAAAVATVVLALSSVVPQLIALYHYFS